MYALIDEYRCTSDFPVFLHNEDTFQRLQRSRPMIRRIGKSKPIRVDEIQLRPGGGKALPAPREESYWVRSGTHLGIGISFRSCGISCPG